MELFCEEIDFLTTYIKRVFNFTYFFINLLKFGTWPHENSKTNFIAEETSRCMQIWHKMGLAGTNISFFVELAFCFSFFFVKCQYFVTKCTKTLTWKVLLNGVFFFIYLHFGKRKQKKLLPVENIKNVCDDQIASINNILNPNALNWN